MKKHYLYLLILLVGLGCKKSKTADTDPATPTPTPPTMHVIITSSQLFSYNITEEDPVTNEFTVKDDYNIASLDYSFTPQPGHVVTIEAASSQTGTMAATITYKDKDIGPVVTHGNGSNPGTGFEFTYTVPNN